MILAKTMTVMGLTTYQRLIKRNKTQLQYTLDAITPRVETMGVVTFREMYSWMRGVIFNLQHTLSTRSLSKVQIHRPSFG